MSNYLYISSSPDGFRNLAVDEYFLDTLSENDILLYFYINSAAVIIGRGQNPWAECRLSEMAQDNVQLVRRITGGGAVFHDSGNLNFSFIMGEKFYDVSRQLQMIQNAVQAMGIDCEFSGRNDLLANGRKFSGNAFCLRKGLRQHHGTLLIRSELDRLQNYLNVDPRKLKAKGTKSVRSRVCNLSEFASELSVQSMLSALCKAFEAEYGAYRVLDASDISEEALAPYLAKHSSDAWRLGHTPKFDLEIDNRFDWGNVQLLLTLRNGHISELDVFSDALDPSLSDTIRSLLQGLPLDPKALAAPLLASDNPQLHDLATYLSTHPLV